MELVSEHRSNTQQPQQYQHQLAAFAAMTIIIIAAMALSRFCLVALLTPSPLCLCLLFTVYRFSTRAVVPLNLFVIYNDTASFQFGNQAAVTEYKQTGQLFSVNSKGPSCKSLR